MVASSRSEAGEFQSLSLKHILDFTVVLMRKFPSFSSQLSTDLSFWIKQVEIYPSPDVLSSFKNIIQAVYNNNKKEHLKEMLGAIITYSIPETEELSYYLFSDTKPNPEYFKHLLSLF